MPTPMVARITASAGQGGKLKPPPSSCAAAAAAAALDELPVIALSVTHGLTVDDVAAIGVAATAGVAGTAAIEAVGTVQREMLTAATVKLRNKPGMILLPGGLVI